jgi:hypothetical protein
LAGLLQLSGDNFVVQGSDTIFFPFADPLPQVIGFPDIFRRQTCLSQIGVYQAQTGVGNGEIGIEIDGAFVETE